MRITKTLPLLLAAIGLALAAAPNAAAQKLAPRDFKELDKNKDGWLVFAEFDAGRIDFDALDVNKDDAVSASEYEAVVDEWKSIRASIDLVEMLAASRAYFLREEKLPESPADLQKTNLINDIPLDPWGREYSFWMSETYPSQNSQPAKKSVEKAAEKEEGASEGKKEGKEDAKDEGEKIVKAAWVPWQDLPNSRSGNELLSYYSLRSAGADGEFGNEDDIYRNQVTSGMPTSEFQLRRAVLSDGEAYQLAVKAWVNEQAFRLWLVIAETEYTSGEAVTDLSGLELPSTPFPNGKAEDHLGRAFKLVSVKGLRALRVEKGSEAWQSDFSLRESDFVSVLLDRVARSRGGRNYQYNINNLFNYANQFRQRSGRLPLSASELRSATNNNMWAFRDDNGGMLLYLPLENGSNMLVVNLGSDRAAGGVSGAMDQCYYADLKKPDAEDEKNNYRNNGGNLNWEGAERERFNILQEAVKKANGENQNGRSEASAEEIRAMLEQLDENADPEFVELMRQRLREAEAREAAKAAGEEDETEIEPEEPMEDPEDESEDGDGVSFQDGPAPPEPEKAKEEEEKEEEAKPETREAKPETEKIEVEEPKAKTAEEIDAEIRKQMIPVRLYNDNEAQFLEIATDTSWEFNINYQRVQQLGYALRGYFQETRQAENGVENPPEMPFGNLKHSNGDGFNASSHAENWRDNYSYYEDQIEEYIVAKMKILDNNQGIETLCLGLLPANQDMPIFCSFSSNRSNARFYAREKDQPEGWRKLVTERNGTGSVATDPAKAAEKGAEDDKKEEGKKPKEARDEKRDESEVE